MAGAKKAGLLTAGHSSNLVYNNDSNSNSNSNNSNSNSSGSENLHGVGSISADKAGLRFLASQQKRAEVANSKSKSNNNSSSRMSKVIEIRESKKSRTTIILKRKTNT